jgi:peroxisome-assembly ATPase
MLMDLFYETLPRNITSKNRIHFHNFMQDVHKRLHAIKEQHGDDLDAILYVAADIAEKSSVLCFDEFQCTDVADAMILRRWVVAMHTRLRASTDLSCCPQITRRPDVSRRRPRHDVESPSR